MLNVANCEKTQRDSMAPTRLIRDINRILKNESGIPEKFRNIFSHAWDISKHWGKICMLLLLRWIHLDIVEALIFYSVQNWYQWWINLNLISQEQRKTLLKYSIEKCNYVIFTELLVFNNSLITKKDVLNYILFGPLKTTTEETIRNTMLKDVLDMWIPLNQELIKRVVMGWYTIFIDTIFDSKIWKTLLTPNFLEELRITCWYSLGERLRMKKALERRLWKPVEILDIAKLQKLNESIKKKWNPQETINKVKWDVGILVLQ